MAHQQIAIAGIEQPVLQQVGIAPLAALETIDAQQPAVGAQAFVAGLATQRGRAQRTDDARLDGLLERDAAQHARRGLAQPGHAGAVALLEQPQQTVADNRQLVHVLVPVHIIGRAAESGLERVELARQVLVDPVRVQAPGVGAQDQAR